MPKPEHDVPSAIWAGPLDDINPITLESTLTLYGQFARDVLAEDSGLAIWEDPRYRSITERAIVDRDKLYEDPE